MKQLLQHLRTGQTSIADIPAPLIITGLAFSLLVPSIALVQKYLGIEGMLAYLIIGTGILFLGHWTGLYVRIIALSKFHVLLTAVITFTVLTILFWLIYPIANSGVLGSGGSDSDDALNIATRALLSGKYPYTQKTYLNNPISPMPGQVILSIPLVLLLGNSSYMSIFSIVAFFVVVWVYTKSGGSAITLLLLMLILSPVVLCQIVTGGDYLFNTIYIFVMFYATLRATESEPNFSWKIVLFALLLGLGFSSRSNFVFLAPLLFSALVENRGMFFSIRYMLLVGTATLFVTLPFYLYDPLHFSPFHTANKLTSLDTVIPFSSIFIVITMALVSIWFALKHGNHNFALLCRRAMVIQAIPVVSGVILLSIKHQAFVPQYSFFGLFFLVFGAFGYWDAIISKSIHENG